MKKYDQNGDGRLDEKERPSREEAMKFFRAQGGGGRPGEGRPDQGGAGGRPGEGRPGRPGEGGAGGRPGQGGGFRPPNSPIMTALDSNKDGSISAEEMKNAAKALIALDKNKDGKLDREELRPQFGSGRFGRPGGDRRESDRPDSRRREPNTRPDFRRPGGDRPERNQPRRPGEGDKPRPKRSDA